METQQYHDMWAILFTCHKTGLYYCCLISLLIKIFHLFSTKTIKFLRLPNFFHLEKLSICFNIFIPRLKKATPSHTQKSYDRIPSRRGHATPLKLNGANPLKFYLLLCLLAPLFDPLLLFITNIALGVEALFLQHTIFCPTMDTNTFVSSRIKRKLDLRVAGHELRTNVT